MQHHTITIYLDATSQHLFSMVNGIVWLLLHAVIKAKNSSTQYDEYIKCNVLPPGSVLGKRYYSLRHVYLSKVFCKEFTQCCRKGVQCSPTSCYIIIHSLILLLLKFKQFSPGVYHSYVDKAWCPGFSKKKIQCAVTQDFCIIHIHEYVAQVLTYKNI